MASRALPSPRLPANDDWSPPPSGPSAIGLLTRGQIEDTIEASSDSVLERLKLDPESAPTLEQETGYIEAELRRLRLALYGDTPTGPENTLSYRLVHPYSRARA